MPEGPFGGPRPFVDCRTVLLVYGNPNNPPSRTDVQDAINSAGQGIGVQYVDNVVEQNIDTDKIGNIASNGVVQCIIIEFTAGKALSLGQDGEALLDLRDEIMSETGAATFLLAR